MDNRISKWEFKMRIMTLNSDRLYNIIMKNPEMQWFLDKDNIYSGVILDEDIMKRKKIIVWEQGTWFKGTWKGGIWKYGYWYDGTWEDGTWKNGDWNSGIWKKGIWEKGTWRGGDWQGGHWERGYDKKLKFHKNPPNEW